MRPGSLGLPVSYEGGENIKRPGDETIETGGEGTRVRARVCQDPRR